MPTPTKRPPAGLGPDGRVEWRRITSGFALEPQDWSRLTIACKLLDVAARAEARVKADGDYLVNKLDQLYPHPGLAVQVRAYTLYLKALREMGLDVAAASDVGRPPDLAPRAFLRRGA